MIQAILFDAGGTLIHVDGSRVAQAAGVAWDADGFLAAENAAVDAVREWILAHPRSTDAERLPRFLGVLLSRLGVPGDRRDEAARAVAAEHARANLWSAAFPDARATLAALGGRGYRLGVISNADGRVRALLERADLLPALELVVDSSEVGFEKPDPRIFLEATRRLELPPAACAYVGDIYEIDVLGARAAGLDAVLVGTGAAPPDAPRVASLTALLDRYPGRPRPA